MQELNDHLMNQPINIRKEFIKFENNYFNAMCISNYNEKTGEGKITWKRYGRKARMAFASMTAPFEEVDPWDFPPAYGVEPELPFKIDFLKDNTIRLRISARDTMEEDNDSLMLVKTPEIDSSWEVIRDNEHIIYKGIKGTVKVQLDPMHIEFRDTNGKLLTRTQHISDTKSLENCNPLPFSFVKLTKNVRRYIAASFTLAHDEKIYGCGESFTKLDKRGQVVNLWTMDALGVQTPQMYKPIPFFMSSRGYGMFVHTSTPTTFDFGSSYDQANVIYLANDFLDLFVFMGTPKEILSSYTTLTGKSPMPPIWSFGLWMSRITYKSELETREVANLLRKYKIPCDVIHLDTGWFEEDWKCNYKFSKTRFENPRAMISDLKKIGFKISLWQLPYFTPSNELYKEAVEKGYAVKNAEGSLAAEDAILDFSNPEAVLWYQNLLKSLLEMGVSAIKADFGEGAPLEGVYQSGKSGLFEHNLYPLRYNKAVYEITKQVTGEGIIWGRSAWAGSQRYPLHWGGDAENTDNGMAASLRAGISLGLCGFSFWSHDIGGFVKKSPEELYRRWLPFGMLTSHSRCHGEGPKEPWEYNKAFTNDFRKAVELKYSLMPYIIEQAKICSEKGFPMIRSLFFEYPEDITAWYIEDAYMLGSDLLVAPLMEENTWERKVYLPKGNWVDYQTSQVYEGEKWQLIKAGEIPIILLVKEGATIPHAKIAQHTGDIDWKQIELRKF